MADLNQKYCFIFEAGKFLPLFCSHFVTRVFAVPKDGGLPEHRGSALLCSMDGNQAFVTAMHVLTDIEKESRFSNWGFSSNSVNLDIVRHDFPDIDVSVIIPKEHLELESGKDFWPSEKSDASCDLLIQDYMIVEGYPDLFARFSAFMPGFHTTIYPHCTSIRPLESQFSEEELERCKREVPEYGIVPDSLLRSGQFALNYAENTGPIKSHEGKTIETESVIAEYSRLYQDGVALPGQRRWGAFGMSGSPVWRFGASECDWEINKWSSDITRITGIVTDWNEGQQILIATPFFEIVRRLSRVSK